jgi:hypothetical protein
MEEGLLVQSLRGASFETPTCGGLLRMRSSFAVQSQNLMVRRRVNAVSNHEAELPSVNETLRCDNRAAGTSRCYRT